MSKEQKVILYAMVHYQGGVAVYGTSLSDAIARMMIT